MAIARDDLNVQVQTRKGWTLSNGRWVFDLIHSFRYSDTLPNIFADEPHWFHGIEGEMMEHGWKFGARDGVFVAYRSADKKLVTAKMRDEVIALAFLEEPKLHKPTPKMLLTE